MSGFADFFIWVITKYVVPYSEKMVDQTVSLVSGNAPLISASLVLCTILAYVAQKYNNTGHLKISKDKEDESAESEKRDEYKKTKKKENTEPLKFDPFQNISLAHPTHPGYFASFFLVASGSSPCIVSLCPTNEKIIRYAYGYFIFFAAILSAVAAHIFINITILKTEEFFSLNPASIIPSIMYGGFIYCFDLSIACSTEKNAKVFIARLLISVVIGLTVTGPITVAIFKDRIDAYIRQHSEQAAFDAAKIKGMKEELSELENKKNTANEKMMSNKNRASCYEAARNKEHNKNHPLGNNFYNVCNGMNFGWTGKNNGGLKAAEYERLRVFEDSLYESEKKEHERLDTLIIDKNVKITDFEKDSTSRATREIKNDFAEHHMALWEIMMTGKIGESVMIFSIISIFMIIDLAVLIIKYTKKTWTYDFIIEEFSLHQVEKRKELVRRIAPRILDLENTI